MKAIIKVALEYGEAVIITPEGEVTPFDYPNFDGPSNGVSDSLEVLQEAVGGNIEYAPQPWGTGWTMSFIINEEGKVHNLPFNPCATVVWHNAGGSTMDVLVGTVIVHADKGDCTFCIAVDEED